MRSRKVSPGFDVTRTLIESDNTRVPPVTADRSPPDSRMTGADSPVIADSSTEATPSTISPSAGISSPAYTTTKHAVLALTHSFNMDECVNGLRACCLSPGEVATPILKLRPVVPSEQEQARMLQPEDCGRTIAFVASMPPRVCVNEILISPTWNRGFVQTPNNRD